MNYFIDAINGGNTNATLQSAVRAKDNELRTLKDEVTTLKNKLTVLKNKLATLKAAKDNSDSASPLILCLIDGDGCIFNKDLLTRGMEGGRDAAFKLRQHVIAHHGANTDILVHIFFKRQGLSKALKTYLNVEPEAFSAFIEGFNAASPFMSMLDVGVGKEAADTKIRELMRMFVRYPHVKKVYFGGGHDNGYTTNLNMIQNEGYLDKIVLLKSYTQLAAEIKALGLPYLENNGVFLSQRLSAKSMNSGSKSSNLGVPVMNVGAPVMNVGIPGMNGGAPGTNSSESDNKALPEVPVPKMASMSISTPKSTSSSIEIISGKNTEANIDIIKALKPRLCIFHYLYKAGCPTGLSPSSLSTCRHPV